MQDKIRLCDLCDLCVIDLLPFSGTARVKLPRMQRRFRFLIVVLGLSGGMAVPAGQVPDRRASGCDVQEATIDQIQDAIRKKQVTTRAVVESYLRRIKAYNGTCVNEPQGILGRITTIP